MKTTLPEFPSYTEMPSLLSRSIVKKMATGTAVAFPSELSIPSF